jgi:hypothetical protein
METFKIRDWAFAHAKYSTDYQESKYIIWDRGPITESDKFVFYTDHALPTVLQERSLQINKIAWLLEPVEIQRETYDFVKVHHSLFDLILSHNLEFIIEMQNLGANAIWVPFGGCWIKPEDQKIYEKSEMISIVASDKTITPNHRMRHSVIQKCLSNLTVRGRGYVPVDYKLDVLKDFRFHVVIENGNQSGWFTEKLIDCFATGTIPIYLGNPLIGEIFHEEGMILCYNEQQIIDAINLVTPEMYEERIEHIKNNFEIAKEYLIAEDYIYKNIIAKWNDLKRKLS